MPGLASHSLAGFSIGEKAPELHLNRHDDVEKELDGALPVVRGVAVESVLVRSAGRSCSRCTLST